MGSPDPTNASSARFRIMEDYCHHRGKSNWCEKSITSLSHLDVLDEVFPDAQVICLYRQCLDVAASGLEAIESTARGFDFDQHLAFHRSDPRIALIEYWYDRSAKLRDYQSASGGRSFSLLYEELVSNPQQNLTKLAAFLGLDWGDEVTERALQAPGHIGPGDEKAYTKTQIDPASVGAGARLNWNGVPRSLLKKVAVLQADLGYPDRGVALS